MSLHVGSIIRFITPQPMGILGSVFIIGFQNEPDYGYVPNGRMFKIGLHDEPDHGYALKGILVNKTSHIGLWKGRA